MDLLPASLLALAGLIAGAVNAVAGGGSLLLFPTMLAVGVPPVSAAMTQMVPITAGYVAAVGGSRADLAGQASRLTVFAPLMAAGALTGGVLLLGTPQRVFELIAPLLILAASLLLAFSDRASKLVGHPHRQPRWLRYLLVFGVGLYGGYFASMLGVVLIAVLGLLVTDSLRRIAALKNVLQLASGVVATIVYSLFGQVSWWAVALLLPMTLAGGYAGAHLARRLPAALLRRIIVSFGIAVSALLFLRAVS